MPAPERELPQQLFKYSGLFPKGIQGHYNDAEIDALLAGCATKDELAEALANATGSAVTIHPEPIPELSPESTPLSIIEAWKDIESGIHVFDRQATAIIHAASLSGTSEAAGESRPTETKVMDITMFLPGFGTTYLALRSTTVNGAQSPVESKILSQSGTQWFSLTSPQADKPFENPRGVDIFAPSGGSGGGAVYEQADPPATANTGDLWLSPVEPVVSMVADAISKNEQGFSDILDEHIRKLLLGGKQAPPDTDWILCPKVSGSGDLYVRSLNGIAYLKGQVVITTSRWTHIRNLPADFPKPANYSKFVTAGAEAGKAERVVAVFVSTEGKIEISTLGLTITDVDLTGSSFPLV